MQRLELPFLLKEMRLRNEMSSVDFESRNVYMGRGRKEKKRGRGKGKGRYKNKKSKINL